MKVCFFSNKQKLFNNFILKASLIEKFQRSCQTEEDLALARSVKQEHKQTYVRARIAIEDLRLKALSDPIHHVFIQLDDMDNHKVIVNLETRLK